METLNDLLGYAPESVDCLKLQVAILAAREAQVVGTLLKKAERLLETAEQVAAQVASPLAPHGSGGGGGTPLRKGEQVYYLQSDGSRRPGTVVTVHTDEVRPPPPYPIAEGY